MKSLHQSIKSLPKNPGIYKFLSKKGEILYIGKATDLSSRVRSYFSKDLIVTRGPALLDMVTSADHVEYIQTDTVIEALLLEAELIKKYLPKYNTKEKDNKSFLCVVITDEPLPQVLQIRKKDIDFKNNTAKLKTKTYKTTAIYGPFASGSQLREAMKIIRRIFPYIDTSSIKKDNYEFYRQLGLTPDTTDTKVAVAYKEIIKNIKLFFEGKKKKIITNLKKEMLAYAKAKEFEQAQEIKRRIFALEHINDTSLIKSDFLESNTKNLESAWRIEAYDVAHTSGKNMVGVMVVLENGQINKNEYRQFNIKTVSGANDPASLAEIITRRLGHANWELPQLIVVDGNDIQKKTAEKVIKTKGFNIPVVAVVKDEKHRPKELLGEQGTILKYKKEILLTNSEAHRFSIGLHRQKRGKSFLG
ncbi:MAG: GIY-YIG nuclease family protein [bacterium]